MPNVEQNAGALYTNLCDFMRLAQAKGMMAEIGDRMLLASGLLPPHVEPTVLRRRLVAVTGGPLGRHNPYLVGTFEHETLEASILDIADVRPTEAFSASSRPGGAEALPEIALFGLRQRVAKARHVELCEIEAEIFFGRMSDQIMSPMPWWR